MGKGSKSQQILLSPHSLFAVFMLSPALAFPFATWQDQSMAHCLPQHCIDSRGFKGFLSCFLLSFTRWCPSVYHESLPLTSFADCGLQRPLSRHPGIWPMSKQSPITDHTGRWGKQIRTELCTGRSTEESQAAHWTRSQHFPTQSPSDHCIFHSLSSQKLEVLRESCY